MKRKDYISWDEYFMGLALLSAERSKDPNSQVGACVVDEDKYIVSVGYNGFPRGVEDDDLPWDREGGFLETKYAYVCHAEVNAIVNAKGRSMKGCSIYVALFPCNECAKIIIQSGITEVVYADDKYDGTDSNVAAKKLFELAGVRLRKYERTGREVKLSV